MRSRSWKPLVLAGWLVVFVCAAGCAVGPATHSAAEPSTGRNATSVVSTGRNGASVVERSDQRRNP